MCVPYRIYIYFIDYNDYSDNKPEDSAMITHIQKRRPTVVYRLLSAFIAFTFIFSVVMPPANVFASTALSTGTQVVPDTLLNLPAPGTMVPMTSVCALRCKTSCRSTRRRIRSVCPTRRSPSSTRTTCGSSHRRATENMRNRERLLRSPSTIARNSAVHPSSQLNSDHRFVGYIMLH